MLNAGIIPTKETLDIACKYSLCQNIYLILERKIFPTMENLKKYIGCNIFKSYGKYDNINIDTMLKVFFEFGLKFDDELVLKCIEKRIDIDYSQYGVKYTMDMYNSFSLNDIRISEKHMKQFLSLPDIAQTISFREAFKKKTWVAISKLGLNNEFIPDQECLNIACLSPYIDVSINLLRGAKIITNKKLQFKNGIWSYDCDYEDEYVNFLLKKTVPLKLTLQNTLDLERKGRIECLGHISRSFIQHTKNDTNECIEQID